MDKKLTFWSTTAFVMLYFVAVFAAEFIGFAHPVCWILAPALGALLAALPFRWLSLRWHSFGLGTALALVFGLLMLLLGELDLPRLAICVGGGLLCDIVRSLSRKDFLAYPLLALGNIAEIICLWTRKAWYLQGAADEMGQAYADAMAPLQTGAWLFVALLAIVGAALCGLWIANRLIKQ